MSAALPLPERFMNTISSLSLKNIRCFAQRQRARLGKISLLVGENNSGKSTFLGCCAAFARLSSFSNLHDPVDSQDSLFDEQPYAMGGFETIARDGEDSFELDGTIEGNWRIRIRFEFGGRQGRPSERSVEIRFTDSQGVDRILQVCREIGPPEIWRCNAGNSGLDIPQSELSYREISSWISASVLRGILPYGGETSTYRKKTGVDPIRLERFAKLTNLLRSLPFDASPIPVHSSSPDVWPRLRRYPEIPLNMANNDPMWRDLSEFGNKLGLFEDIKGVPDSETQTFILKVLQSGRWRNIVDVGYGVHSILPTLCSMSRRRSMTTFLMQQPEVQLHPCAQAALAHEIAESPHRFVIETHSDHLLDHFRICVMEGVLAPENLRIIYFERDADRLESTIHNIAVDRNGNLLNVPAGYRDFFMHETIRLLGFEENCDVYPDNH